MKFTLRKKLILSILLIILFFGSVATISIFNYSKNVVFNLQKEKLQKSSIENARLLFKSFDIFLDLADSVSNNQDIINYLQNENSNLQEAHILQHLNMYKFNDFFDVVYLMDSDGLTLVSTDESFVNKNYGFRDYFKQAMEGKTAVDVSLGVTSKKLGYYFSAPVYSNNTVLGVVVIKVKPEIVDIISENVTDEDDIDIMMLDKYGIVIYSSNENDKLYRSIGPLSSEVIKLIEEEKRYDGIAIESMQYKEVIPYLNTGVLGAIITIYDKVDVKDEIISISGVGNLPFFLIIEEDLDKYASLSNNIATILSLIVFITAIMSVLIIFLFVNSFVKPINKLKETAQQLSKGKLSARVGIKTGDELEDLANTFNMMASKMEKNIKNIEEEVAKRTQKLEQLNSYMIGRELKMVELKNQLKKQNKI